MRAPRTTAARTGVATATALTALTAITAITAITAMLSLPGCSSTGASGLDPVAQTALAFRAQHGAPPETRRVDVVDDYHGTAIEDPFRWLEDQDSEEVLAWADAQNAYTEAFLGASARRPELRRRLEELWNHARYSPPERDGAVWTWFKNDGLQNQSVLYKADRPDAAGAVLLDPNTFSADGTVALGGASLTDDGRLLAYSISRSGSDWREWKVVDVATGEHLDDHLQWTKFTGAAWTEDGDGFFYQRYRAPEEDKVYEQQNLAPQLCYHRIGTAQDDDEVVYERPDEPTWSFRATVTEDGRYLVVDIGVGTDRRNRVAYLDLEDRAAGVQPLLMEFDASYAFVGNDATRLWFRTDLQAEFGRVVQIDLEQPAREHWVELIPERAEKLQAVHVLADQLVAVYLRDARHAVRRFGLDGTPLGEIELPGIGSVSGFEGRREDRQTFFSFQGFTRPPTIYRYDFDADEVSLFREPELRFDPDRFVTEQVALQSADGTRLNLFLVHAPDLRLDADNPVYLYGYGGFDISLTPRFSVPDLAWVELGGVYAQATLRGGGEYGEAWHRAGMLQDKQNVFDDFVACARYLIRNDYTRAEKLAIGGGSNGGLLVGACLTQRPELFGAALPAVGVMDMLRYHEFTIGWAWASEYGRSDDPEMFEVLRAYSPLHNVRPGTAYPPTLVTTGDHDDRVLPGHSYKFAATLQAAQGGDAPILLRVTRKAGHGGGKPMRLRIDEAADRLAFLELALGIGRE